MRLKILILMQFVSVLCFSQNQNTTFDSLSTALTDTWVWAETQGGFVGTITTPATEGYAIEVVLKMDSLDIAQHTISYVKKWNDVAVLTGRANLQLSNTTAYNDTLWKINAEIFSDSSSIWYQPGEVLYLFDMNSDSIILVDFYGDGYSHTYVRKGSLSSTLSVEFSRGAEVKLFPNPASAEIAMKIKGFDNYSIEVVDILGRSIYHTNSEKNPKGLITINTNHFLRGKYFVTVRDQQKVVSKMFIIN